MDWMIVGPIIGTVIGGLLVGGNNLLAARTQRVAAREARKDEREAAREERKADRDHEHLKTVRQAYADLCSCNARLFDRAHYVPFAMFHLEDHKARTARAEMQAVYGAEQKAHAEHMKAIGLELGETLTRILSEFNAARVDRDNKAVFVLLLEEDPAFQEQLRDIIREEIILPNGSVERDRYLNEVRVAQNHQAKLINALSGRFGVSKLDDIARNARTNQLQPPASTPQKELPAADAPRAPPNDTTGGG